ncbi:MAG: hypothetical protein SCJ94_02595 [Bacillota bacterium]|nr:hypothetical protein [Bacillota bacterium]
MTGSALNRLDRVEQFFHFGMGVFVGSESVFGIAHLLLDMVCVGPGPGHWDLELTGRQMMPETFILH